MTLSELTDASAVTRTVHEFRIIDVEVSNLEAGGKS